MTVHSQYQEYAVNGLLDHIQKIAAERRELKVLLRKAYLIIATPERFGELTDTERAWGVEIQQAMAGD